jgi:hypothetical protein
MSLLNKASIVTTPTAYENGKILSVKPSIVLGDELVVNGDFATDSYWTKSGGATISGGQANIVGDGTSFTNIIQHSIFTIGKKYKVSVDVTISSGLGLKFQDGANNENIGFATTSGTYVFYFTGTSNANFVIGRRTGGTAFNSSVNNVSVKEALDADFQFTRNSSATRVNSQGLIEDMQILSGDLVSNGDFSQEGSEEITNGNFATDSDWTKIGTTISNGQANFVNSGGVALYQNVGTQTTFLKVTFEVTQYTSGVLKVYSGSNQNISDADLVGVNLEGLHTIYIPRSGTNGNIIFGSSSGEAFTGSIDNVSVKEVGQDWNVANEDANNYVEFNQDEGTVRLKFLNTSPLTNFTSNTQYLSGKKYKLIVDVKEAISGGVKIDSAGVSQTYNSAGIQEAIIEPTGNSNVSFYRATANVDITLNSVSLIEITEDTNLPRIDYTGGEGHWLFEPQSTNLLLDSGFNDVKTTVAVGYWYKSPNASVSENSVIGVDGLQSAATYTYNGGGPAEYVYGYQIAVTSGATYTVSGYVKLGTASNFAIVLNNTTSWNTIPNANFVATAVDGYDNWKRFEITFVAPLTNKINIHLGFNQENGVAAQTNGSVFIDSFQLEQQSFATSIIPTEGSIKTRLADAAFGAGSSDLINSTEGTLYAEISALDNLSSDRRIAISDGSISNRIFFYYAPSTDQISAIIVSGGATQVNIPILGVQAKNNKFAIKYKVNDVSFWVNGFEIGTDVVATMPSNLSELAFDDGNGNNPFYGNVKCVAVFKEALNNDELECLTGEGYETFNALALANNYTII